MNFLTELLYQLSNLPERQHFVVKAFIKPVN